MMGTMRFLPLLLSSGVLIVGMVPAALTAGIGQQVVLPPMLVKHLEVLTTAPTLTVEYKLRVIGESPSDYKLVLSQPDRFRLTTPTGFILSDGKTVTTYKSATKTFTEEPYTIEWVTDFVKKPEVVAWGAFLVKNPAESFLSARAGATRTIQGNEVTEVEASLKKNPTPVTFYIDKQLGVARGYTQMIDGKSYLAMASFLEIGADPMDSAKFAFVPPAGAKKEEVAVADFKGIQALMSAKCMPCHNSQNRRDGVDLSNYNGILATVVPGNPTGSRLVRSVRASGRNRMPKDGMALPEAEIKRIEAWIQAGAKQ